MAAMFCYDSGAELNPLDGAHPAGWTGQDFFAAVQTHARKRGNQRTIAIIGTILNIKEGAKTTMLLSEIPSEAFGPIIAVLCQDMTGRPHRLAVRVFGRRRGSKS